MRRGAAHCSARDLAVLDPPLPARGHFGIHMTIEEVEDVVRALTEKLETGAAKQSILEAFMQTHAYADEMLLPASERPLRQRQVEA